jgi:arginase family enzyme
MLLDDGVVRAADTALVGVRNLDPGERDFLAETGIDDSLERALAGVDAVYVALDLDVLDPKDAAVFVPEPGGPEVAEIERILAEIASRAPLAGAGVTGHLLDDRNGALATRLLAAAGL